jgi:hypothetical protein
VWRQFLVIGSGMLLVGGLLFVAGLGGQDVANLPPVLALLGMVLAGIGAMLLQAGLVGAAIGADWRSIQKGQERLDSGDARAALSCGQCGEPGNRVGSLYCRTCGAQLSSLERRRVQHGP